MRGTLRCTENGVRNKVLLAAWRARATLLPQLSEEVKKVLMNRVEAAEAEAAEATELSTVLQRERLSALLDWVLYLHKTTGHLAPSLSVFLGPLWLFKNLELLAVSSSPLFCRFEWV